MPDGEFVIEAIADERERAAFAAAAEQLREAFGGWRVELRLSPNGAPAAPIRPQAIVRSLLPEVDRDDDPSVLDRRLRAELRALADRSSAVFITTVFRSVRPHGTARADVASPLLERIRRLDLLSAELSHDLDIAVIDIDRAFAYFGARTLQCDYRPSSRRAIEAAGHTIASALVAAAPELGIPSETEERARAFLGDLRNLPAFIRGRLDRDKDAARHGPG